jgi:hypothetical protein
VAPLVLGMDMTCTLPAKMRELSVLLPHTDVIHLIETHPKILSTNVAGLHKLTAVDPSVAAIKCLVFNHYWRPIIEPRHQATTPGSEFICFIFNLYRYDLGVAVSRNLANLKALMAEAGVVEAGVEVMVAHNPRLLTSVG